MIYGLRTKVLHEEILPIDKCDHCENYACLILTLKARYLHIFFIPFIPLKKNSEVNCSICAKKIKQKKYSNSIVESYFNIKQRFRYPLWMFTGLWILISLSTMAVLQSNTYDKKELAWFTNPKSKDTYTIKTKQSEYTTFKILQVTPDSLYVLFNDKSAKKFIKASSLDKTKNYTSNKQVIGRDSIKNMFENGLILNIKRKNK